jgi:hypothetical protein
VSHAEAATIQG